MTTQIKPTAPQFSPTSQHSPAELDRLLADVCEALQITQTQFRNAEEKYQNVGKWLAAPESPITTLKPEIYPQGSMALQTTVRPWTDEDSYDLDLVLQVEPTSDDPMTLYRLVERRLRENPHYRDILVQKKRCLCLNFTGHDEEFHMDILPARIDTVRGNQCIEVPDKSAPTRWQPSNPRGYQKWFEDRATREAILLAERKQEPLPDNDPAYAKAVLKRAVQLMKRRRDLMIRDEELSPRSVVLTTLAGTYYRGEQDVALALVGIFVGIKAAIEAARPARITVCNPTNSDEKFCESFRTQRQYDAFIDYVDRFLAEMNSLLSNATFTKLEPALAVMFGEKVTRRALLEYGERLSEARENNNVRIANTGAKAALAIGAGVSGANPTPRSVSTGTVPKNTFYGE